MTDIKGTDTRRSADNVIKGFIYQFLMSLDAWINLKENEILILEGAEDLDIYKDSTVETIQVKHKKAKISLNSHDTVEAIANFWRYHECNPDKEIIFRFISTSESAEEKGSPFGQGIHGLQLWSKSDKTPNDIVASVVVLGADEGVDPETTTKNPHPIDIAGEKPPLASLTSLTQRGMRARSGRRGAKRRFEERVRKKQEGLRVRSWS